MRLCCCVYQTLNNVPISVMPGRSKHLLYSFNFFIHACQETKRKSISPAHTFWTEDHSILLHFDVLLAAELPTALPEALLDRQNKITMIQMYCQLQAHMYMNKVATLFCKVSILVYLKLTI